MLAPDAVDRAARRLADAHRTRIPLDGHQALGEDVPTDAAAAYAIQARMRELAGLDTGAWKVGATSEAAQQLLGVDAPFLGVVAADRIVPSGHEFVIGDWFAGTPAFEVEIGLRPHRSLVELPDDPLDLAELVDVVPCIEVVDCRFGVLVGTPGPCIVADNGVASALVVGDQLDVDLDAIRALDALPVRLVVDGGDPVDGVGSMALGHPLVSLHTAASIARDLGTPVEAGQVVTTGTCTGLTPVTGSMSIVGTVGAGTPAAASISARFVGD